MKKTVARFFTLATALIFACTSVFAAGRTMTKKEHKEFLDRLTAIMVKYCAAAKTEDLNRFTQKVDECNDNFDRENGFSVYDLDITHCTKTFAQAMELCHSHVLDTAALVKQPFNCRGLSLFVFKELLDRGINCYYTSHWFKDPSRPIELPPDIHSVVMYSVNNEWYICDFARAFSFYVVEKFGAKAIRTVNRRLSEKTNARDLLAIPLKEYQQKRVEDVRQSGGIPIILRARIDRIGWYPRSSFSKFKDKPATEVLDVYNYFDEMTPDELEKYYGVRTMEEAQKLLADKSPDEIRMMFLEKMSHE